MLYGIMRIRMIEERIRGLYAEQEMRCPTHFSIGQEAIAVGVCAHLKQEELITSAHRSHAHYLAKGGDLKAMLAELYGKATGCAAGKGGSMHLIDRSVGFFGAVPVVGSTIPIGVGTAFSSVLQGSPCLTVIFFGDAATETGVFHESLNIAAIHKLPGKVVHVPYTELLKADGTPKEAKDIWAILSKAGVPRYAELVAFSDDPGEAAVNYFVLKLMGFRDAKVLVS